MPPVGIAEAETDILLRPPEDRPMTAPRVQVAVQQCLMYTLGGGGKYLLSTCYIGTWTPWGAFRGCQRRRIFWQVYRSAVAEVAHACSMSTKAPEAEWRVRTSEGGEMPIPVAQGTACRAGCKSQVPMTASQLILDTAPLLHLPVMSSVSLFGEASARRQGS